MDQKFETFPRQPSHENVRPALNGIFKGDTTADKMPDTSPPPLTPPVPKPRSAKPAQPSSSPVAKSEVKEVKEATISDRASLKGFMQNYSGSLPYQIKILQGFYGAKAELHTGETYDIYFKKLAQVVLMEDVLGNKYSVPLNSALQFGLVYDDRNPKFEKVSDILACTNLPKVVRATCSYSSGSEESSIYEDEVLVVLGVHEYETKSKMGLGDILNALGVKQSKRGLQVLSLDSKEEKMIDEQCIGHFVTDPSLLALYLPEIVECFPKPFPSKACVFLDAESTSELPKLPKNLLSTPVSLNEVKTEVSLVASKVEGDSSQSESSALPLLLDLPVVGGFSEVELSVIYDGKLSSRSRDVLENFDPMKLISFKEASSGGRNQKIQASLDAAVRVGHEGDGISLESTCGTKNLTNYEKKADSIPIPAHQVKKADADDEEQVNYNEIAYSPAQDPVPIPPAPAVPVPCPVRPSEAVRQQLASIVAQRRSSEGMQTPSNTAADVIPPPATDNLDNSDDDQDNYEPVDPSTLIDNSATEEQEYVTMHRSDYSLGMCASNYSILPPPVPAVMPAGSSPAPLLERFHDLEVQRKKDRRYLDQTASRLSDLSEQVQSLRKTIQELLQASKYGETAVRSDKVIAGAAIHGAISESSDKNAKDNKRFLRGLDVTQVCFS